MMIFWKRETEAGTQLHVQTETGCHCLLCTPRSSWEVSRPVDHLKEGFIKITAAEAEGLAKIRLI